MTREKEEGDFYESLLYYDFFNRFRSPPETVKQHQAPFIKYFEGRKDVLSIGCGRGEFIEVLREKGIGATGIDVDEEMVAYCQSRGLKAIKADALEYLAALDDESLDGIFMNDLVEHLDTDYLLRMLRLCARKLQPGRFIVVITLNPLSWSAYAGLYLLDPTHKRPIHPETLRFFLGSAGFADVRIEFVTHIGDGHLKKAEVRPDMDADARRIANTVNNNIDLLNKVLFGPENYAAIAKK